MFFRPILDLAVARVGRSRTEAVLRRFGTTEARLRHPTAGISLGLTEQLCDALIEETADPNLVEDACGLATTGRYLWLLRPLLRLMGSPRLAYAQLAEAVPRFNRAGTLEVERWGDPGEHEAVLVYRSDLETHAQLCRGRIGQLTAVPTLFGAAPADVAHPHCLHAGDDRCAYHVRWQDPPPLWRAIVGLLG